MTQAFSDDVYIIDLSYTNSASDIVFELSSIIDNDMAKNKKVALILGDIDLNQSQLLSIRSLVSSINSSVAYIKTTSTQTELAAVNLGIVVSNSKENEPEKIEEQPLVTSFTQSYGYVKLDDDYKTEEEKKEINYAELDKKIEQIEPSIEDFKESHISEKPSKKKKNKYKKDKNNKQVTEEVTVQLEESSDDTFEELKSDIEENSSLIENDLVLTEKNVDEIKNEGNEDIQKALDNIYDTESNLEAILENPEKQQDMNKEEVSEVEIELTPQDEKYTEEDFEIDNFSTTYIKQTLRSGQLINYDGNIVIIGDCHPGSEIIATGDIVVWGVLSGIAHAGNKGNHKARIRALKMNAIQLRIGRCFARKPDGMNTIFPEKTSVFTPEEARVINNEIVIFKINN